MMFLSVRLWFLWPDDSSTKQRRGRNRCGCLGGCRLFGGTNTGLDFFRLEEMMTPSSSSAFSSASSAPEQDMSYSQSLLHPGDWILTKETPKLMDGKAVMIIT